MKISWTLPCPPISLNNIIVIESPLYMYANPVEDSEASNKAYVDFISTTLTNNFITHANNLMTELTNIVNNYENTLTVTALPLGSIIYARDQLTDPPRLLKCDGRYVLKSQYPSLFNRIGHTYDEPGGNTPINLGYTSYLAIGGGQPWMNQYDISITSSTTTLISPRLALNLSLRGNIPQSLVTTSPVPYFNNIYLLGNYDIIFNFLGNTVNNKIYKTNCIQDTLYLAFNEYSLEVPFDSKFFYAIPIVTRNNKLYFLGGYSSNSPLEFSLDAVRLTFNNITGEISSITVEEDVLSGTHFYLPHCLTNLYLFINFSGSNNLVRYTITSNGDINFSSPVNAGTLNFPNLTHIDMCLSIPLRNRLYLIGGNSTQGYNRVYRLDINSSAQIDISSLTHVTNLNFDLFNSARSVYYLKRNELFIFTSTFSTNTFEIILRIFNIDSNGNIDFTNYSQHVILNTNVTGISFMGINSLCEIFGKIFLFGSAVNDFISGPAYNFHIVIDNVPGILSHGDYRAFFDNINTFTSASRNSYNLPNPYANPNPSFYFRIPLIHTYYEKLAAYIKY